MKIDAKELERLAAAQPRMDMYRPIHKALRACMADALLALGRADVQDEQDLAATTQRMLRLLDFCADHLKHENEHVHRAIEARAAGASEAVAHDHSEHDAHIAQLRALTQALRDAPEPARQPVADRLYSELALFMAENLRHMHVEETAHNAVLWARYTDAELVAIHDGLVASIPPAGMLDVVRWLVPFMNPAERLAALAGIQSKAPAPAFQAILDTVRPHLHESEWVKLARGLGLPPVPGLVSA